MATTENKNLFYKLYSTSNDVTSSGFKCSSSVDEGDTSFDITDDEAQITDSNGDELAGIDLSEIHADELTEYSTETKILQPNSAYLLQGPDMGEAFKSQWFRVCELQTYELYDHYCNIAFDILYKQNNKRYNIHINTYKRRTTYGPFTELAQQMLNILKVPVTISIKQYDDNRFNDSLKDYVVFESTQQGYDFMVRNVALFPIMCDDDNADGSEGDYDDSPFKGPNMDLEWLTWLFEKFQPRKKGDKSERDTEKVNYKYEIDCGIYKEFVTIVQDVLTDFNTFIYELEIIKKYFLVLFNEYGECIDEQALEELAGQYPEIYDKYFSEDSILSEYNIHDLVEMFDYIMNYIFSSKINGPHFLLEDLNKRVNAFKYPNGAMRGIVIVPDWPETEDADYKVLLVNHVADQVETMIPVKVESLRRYFGEDINSQYRATLYERAIATVKINALIPEEKTLYIEDENALPLNDITSNDGFTTSFDYLDIAGYDMAEFVENNFHRKDMQVRPKGVWSDAHIQYHDPKVYVDNNTDDPNIWENQPNKARCMFVDTHDNTKQIQIGLYKYMNYLTENDLWLHVGQGYIIVGNKDSKSDNVKNLVKSVLIYNPNDIPIRIKYMIFA